MIFFCACNSIDDKDSHRNERENSSVTNQQIDTIVVSLSQPRIRYTENMQILLSPNFKDTLHKVTYGRNKQILTNEGEFMLVAYNYSCGKDSTLVTAIVHSIEIEELSKTVVHYYTDSLGVRHRFKRHKCNGIVDSTSFKVDQKLIDLYGINTGIVYTNSKDSIMFGKAGGKVTGWNCE